MRISDWSSDVCSSDLKGIERAHRLRTDLAVDDDVGIVALFAVECVQRSLEESDGDLWTHIDASIEQFGGDVRRDFRYGCEAGLLPIDVAVDRLGLISRELPHVPTIAMRASDRLRDAPPGWPPFVRRMFGIAADRKSVVSERGCKYV